MKEDAGRRGPRETDCAAGVLESAVRYWKRLVVDRASGTNSSRLLTIAQTEARIVTTQAASAMTLLHLFREII